MADPSRNGATPASDWVVPPDEQQGLRRYVATLRERWKLIAAVTALALLASIAYILMVTKTYEAESTLYVSPISSANTDLEGLGLLVQSSDPTRDVQTAAELVTTVDVATRVKEDIGYEGTPEALLATVKAEPVAQTYIVAITASASDPNDAAEVATSFAEETVASRTAQMRDQIDRVLDGLKTGSPTSQDQDQISKLERLREGPDPTLRVATEATPPVSPVKPKPILSIIAGLLAGLVLGIAAAFATQILDPKLRREEQLRTLYRLPVIGRIPREPKESGEAPLGPRRISPAVAEAYRTLRGTVTASTRADGAKVLLVTGSSPSEGKTTTAINLAASLSSTGRRVILIEADLRRPAISRALSVEARRGVVGVLIESVSLEDALIDGDAFGLPNLKLLLAENEGGWISELFSLPTAIDLIHKAKELAEYVIIDSPPLTDVVDALPLARNVDDVLVVVRPGTTRISKLEQLGELLAENGIRPMGFAVVGTTPPGGHDSTYYFDHRETFEEQMSGSARGGGGST
ncbi:MAG: AAA family ATPase [Solirubrobacterales bacterium]|nr:AAA family ATPase [Solirubrobacterales bacterium]MCB8970312.1 AAA family ATPase [Thermoleophilales bacterium]MCO5325475.1 Wzz/FepE/Etk N-terminal domain-containing protein [Solirubrobacterales bacterium]